MSIRGIAARARTLMALRLQPARASAASPTPSMRSRSPALHGASPICPSPSSTDRRARCACWSTIVTIWSPSEPVCRAGSAGICTRSRPTLTSLLAASSSSTSSSVSPPARLDRRPDRRHLSRAARPRPRTQPPHQRTRARDQTTHPSARPDAAEHPRLRRADRRQARRRDGRRSAVSLKERLRPLERDRTAARQLGQHHPLPPQPRRQPPSQRRPAPHRPHPSTRLATRTRLHHQTHQTGQHQSRSAATPAPATLRRRPPHPAHRRTRRPTRSRHPHSQDLT